MENKPTKNHAVKRAMLCYCISAVLLCLWGLLLMLFPEFAQGVLYWTCGLVLLVFGISKFVAYFSGEPFHLAFRFDLALGILAVLLGLFLLIRPDIVLSLFWILLGIYEIVDGSFKVQTALEAKAFGFSKWWVLLIGAAASVVFGLLIMLEPWKSGLIFIRLVGVSFLIVGAQNLFTALYMASRWQKLRKENMEKENIVWYE